MDANLYTTVILAGGKASRMSGTDKGLVLYQGQPLIRHALSVAATQCEQILVSANRNLQAYRALGLTVYSDKLRDFPGPLAGLLGLLSNDVGCLFRQQVADAGNLLGDLLRIEQQGPQGNRRHDGRYDGQQPIEGDAGSDHRHMIAGHFLLATLEDRLPARLGNLGGLVRMAAMGGRRLSFCHDVELPCRKEKISCTPFPVPRVGRLTSHTVIKCKTWYRTTNRDKDS